MALAWQPIDLTDRSEDPWTNADPAEVVAVDLLRLLQRPAWHRDAACRGKGPQAWFPGRGEDVRPAMAICQECPVQAECLAVGLEQPEWGDAGIWGGSSARGRRQLRRDAA